MRLRTRTQEENCILPLKQLALNRLNNKQRIILSRIKQAEGVSVSNLVMCLKEELQCTDSALWKTIRSLRNLGLLDNSSSMVLTQTGKLLMGED